MTQNKNSLYCFSSIPQAGAIINFYDFKKQKGDGVKYSIKDVLKIFKDKKFKPVQSNYFEFSCFADGAYPFYVSIDKNKKVHSIYFELRNNCGWGSSMFFTRPERLIQEREMLKNLPEGYQLDMTIPPAMAIQFKARNRKSYFSFSHWKIDGNEFKKSKKSEIKKIGSLKINSNLIVLDDSGDIDRLDEGIDVSRIYKKNIAQKNFYGVDDGVSFDRVTIPVKNKEYPVFIHHKFLTEKEELAELRKDNPKAGIVSPIFPIVSIQNIEGCYLSKDKDAKLVFKKEKEKGLSEYLQNQIKKKEKNLTLCQLDLQDLSSINFVNKLNYKIDRLFLVGFEHVSNWSALLKLKNVKKLLISKCNFDLNKNKNFKIIKQLNKIGIATFIENAIVDLNAKSIEISHANGEYVGEFNNKKNTAEGYGILKLNDGSVYSGYFKNAEFDGFGCYYYASGSLYLGDWKNGNQHGSAIFVSKDGFRYTGNFKNNKYDGVGEFYVEETGETKKVKYKDGVEITE